jgi:hypothetical protein
VVQHPPDGRDRGHLDEGVQQAHPELAAVGEPHVQPWREKARSSARWCSAQRQAADGDPDGLKLRVRFRRDELPVTEVTSYLMRHYPVRPSFSER